MRADFPVFSPSRTPHETSREGVHGRAHEWTVGVHLSCFHLLCSLTNNDKSPVGMTDLKSKEFFGASVVFTAADFKFWRICLVNMSVGMVISEDSILTNFGPLT